MHKFKIKEKLTEYVGFDINLLFNSTDFLVVFGGAIRDIIQGIDVDKINDIDVLCLPESKRKAIDILLENGYVENGFVKKDLHTIYKDIKYIFEPKTFFKGSKIVQLITPSGVLREQNLYLHIKKGNTFYDNDKLLYDDMTIPYYELLSNVDLSSSGVFFDGEVLYESIDKAIYHCKHRVYEVNTDALMYNFSRTMCRVEKLKKNGWNEINNDMLLLYREMKIHDILKKYTPTLGDYKTKMFMKFI